MPSLMSAICIFSFACPVVLPLHECVVPHSRDEHGFGFKSGGFSNLWCIWIGFQFDKSCLTGLGFGFDNLVWNFFGISTVDYSNYIVNLLEWSLSPLSKLYIVFAFGTLANKVSTIQWCKVQASKLALLCHQITGVKGIYVTFIDSVLFPFLESLLYSVL